MTSDTRQDPQPSAGHDPPLADVPDNRWPDIDVRSIGAWRPAERVSVIIPAFGQPDVLDRTLAALDQQTYPRDLLEVIVADDGSDPPLRPGSQVRGLAPLTVRQEHQGFGAGRARNLAVRQSTGDILVFLDADMVSEPWTVEAHARWHHTVSDAVVVGMRQLVDFVGIDREDIARAGSSGSLTGLFDQREHHIPPWVERYLRRSGQMTASRHDLFWIVTSNNLSMRRSTFDAVGGFTPFGMRGIEDTELGYRLHAFGVTFVPDPDAYAWHQGDPQIKGESAAAIKRHRQPTLQHRIPVTPLRPTGAGRRFEVPRLVVHVDASEAHAEPVIDYVDALLAGTLRDVMVALKLPTNDVDADLVRRTFAADERVCDACAADLPRWPQYQLWLPLDWQVGIDTLRALCSEADRQPAGVIEIQLPGAEGDAGTAFIMPTRAVERAQRHARGGRTPVEDADLRRTAATLFGQRQVFGPAVGLQARRSENGPVTLDPLTALESRRPSTAEDLLRLRVHELEAKLSSIRRRKVVRLADTAGRVLRRIRRTVERRLLTRRRASGQ